MISLHERYWRWDLGFGLLYRNGGALGQTEIWWLRYVHRPAEISKR